MKPRILFYSDCSFFAGCENMLAVMFNSPRVLEEFDIYFFHRANPVYEAGFREAVRNPPNTAALPVFDIAQIYSDLGKLPRPFAKIAVLLAKVLCLKNVFLVMDYFRIKARISEIKPDLMFVNNGGHPGAYSALAAVLAGRSAGVGSIVYFVNNLAAGYDSLSRLPDYFFDRMLVASASVLATGSRFTADRLAAVLGLPKQKVRNIYNGIEVYEPNLSSALVRRHFKVPVGRPVILCGGVLEERKGHLVLLKSIKRMKEFLSPDIMPFCLLAGTGSLRDALAGYIGENDLHGDVVLAGHDPNYYNLINACDIYIQPSIYGEDLPNVISMAMACSKPVIGTRVAGIPEQIEDNKTGFVVEPGDPEILAEKIAELVRNPGMAASMGIAGKARFESMFTADAAVRNYLELFRSLLSRNTIS